MLPLKIVVTGHLLGNDMRNNIAKMATIKNYYFLIVGILSILFSLTHAWNGQETVLPVINISSIDQATKTTIFYIWHILTAENFIFGVSFLVMAFYKDLSKVKFAAWMIAAIMIARWGVVFGSSLFEGMSLTDTLTDLIVIILYVGLIILGTRKKADS